VASLVVFGTAVKVMTMEELNLFEGDFMCDVVERDEEGRLRCINLLKRQCLLVIQRIAS
jgi:hypothetical protein